MDTSMKKNLTLALCFSLSAFLICSCGSTVKENKLPESGATLEGTITVNGEQVYYAQVTVTDGKGASASGKVGEGGKYKVENVPLGEVMVGVNSDAAMGDFQSAQMSGGMYAGPDAKKKGAAKVAHKFVKVEAKYFDPLKSGLKTSIQQGNNTYNIVIK
jgi:hypothetical protein